MLATNNKITIRQLQILILLSALGTGVIVLPRRVAQYAGQDGWTVVVGLSVVAVLVGLLISAAVSAATKANPGAGFIQFTSKLLGRPFAYFCGVVLWLKLVLAAGLELRVFLEITQSIMLPNTPIPVVGAAIVLLCIYTAAKGIETRARVAEILFAVMVLPFIFLVGLAFFDTDFTNLQPVLVTPPQNIFSGILGLGFIFTGLECLLLVSPFVRQCKHPGRHIALALGFSSAIILLITLLTIAKFGPDVANQPWPVLRMMDMINIPGSFIERQEALIFTFWIITAFAIGNTMIFFGGVLVKDMLKPRAKNLGVICTGAAAFIVAIFPWEGDVYQIMDYMYLTVGAFFLVVLPLLLLAAAKLRKPKHLVVPMALLLCITIFTACWDRVEIENRAFVVAMAIDNHHGKYQVSLSVPLQEKDEEKYIPHVITATGTTITEALKHLEEKSDKTLYYGQSKLLVLGDALLESRDMTSTTIQAIKHHPQIDLRMNVLAAQGEAKEILEAKEPGETMPGLFIADLYRNKNKLGGASFALDLERLANSYQNGALIPSIKKIDDPQSPLILDGAKVLASDSGNLSPQALEGYLWNLPHGNKGAIVTVLAKGQYVPIKIERHQSQVTFEAAHEGIAVVITLQGEGSLEEPLPHNVTTAEVKALLATHIEKEIATTTQLLQEQYGVDGYDWLDLMRKKNYPLYLQHRDNWDDVFANAHIIIRHVDVTL